ncbi:MAG: caspase family protein, partial [Betaproteobacteria bacterium]|nr:caspase family protein [Betaproteobacteria bacterium]
ALYGQLPYDAQFTVVLDCCHAGGMARAGGARVRGLTPPDDIRHRMIHWDRETQMWLPRQRLLDIGAARTQRWIARQADRVPLLGEHGYTNRLGRATSLWSDKRAYAARKKAYQHLGPYTPMLLEACRENEFAYEYSHGAIPYGAFTYSLCETIRRAAQQNRDRARAGQSTQPLTFAALGEEVAKRIRSVVAEPQTPQLIGPRYWKDKPVPGV